jgi:hypothetical protein
MLEFFIEIAKGIASVFIYSWWLFAILLGIFAFQNRRKAQWVRATENVVLEIKIPKTNDKTPTAAEMMFATLHGILRPKVELVREGSLQEHLSFEIVADMNSIRFFVWTPKHLKDFVEGQIYAQYPSAEINVTTDYVSRINEEEIKKSVHIKPAELVLTREDFLPIKTFNNFSVDPLAGITGVLSKLEDKGEEIWIQILARPESDEWKRRGLQWVANKKGGPVSFGFEESFGKTLIKLPFYLVAELLRALFVAPTDGKNEKSVSNEDQSRIAAIEEKSEKLAFKVKIRAAYVSNNHDTSRGNEKINALNGAFKQYNTTVLNGFKGHNLHNQTAFFEDYKNRIFLSGGYYLNIEELASIYHLPHTSVETPNINWTTSKTGEPPTTIPTTDNTEEEDLTTFAETNFRSHRQIFGIKRDDRRRHTYIIGKSGMGKSKLLENLIDKDIQKGEGVAVIDPHGDLITATLKKIPPERIKDVIVFDPSDVNQPIGFNPMEVIDESLKIQIASGVLGTFKKIFGTSWGPRLEYVFNYTLLALLDTPGSTLLGVVNMLTDKNFRKNIIANIQDPVVKKFWTTEWASYSEKFATEAVAPILNKVGQFTANALIRNIIGQPSSSFNIRKAMDEGKILLINLSTGRVGETNAALMGAMMITAIQLAALSRADIPEDERKDFYLYVDEFQNFATESFAVILSEARKYHLSLTMANQYVAQMEDSGVKDAIFGNVGTIITFRVGAQDAADLSREFNPPFEPQDLINLPRQHIYIRMTIDGQSEQAFSAKTLTVTPDSTNVTDDILSHSRERYTKPRVEVEKQIAEATGVTIETVKLGTETEVKIKTEDSTITVTDDKIFEAPIVRKIKGKNVINKAAQSDAIRKAIQENANADKKAADVKQTPSPTNKNNSTFPKLEKVNIGTNTNKEEKRETEASVSKEGSRQPEAPALKIKDKIDKEILSEILKNVVTPKSNNKDNLPKKVTENVNRGEQQKTNEEPNVKKVENIKEEVVTAPSPIPDPHIKERIITPTNFKDIKEIHPHELVKVMSEDPKELEEGKSIKFE